MDTSLVEANGSSTKENCPEKRIGIGYIQKAPTRVRNWSWRSQGLALLSPGQSPMTGPAHGLTTVENSSEMYTRLAGDIAETEKALRHIVEPIAVLQQSQCVHSTVE